MIVVQTADCVLLHPGLRAVTQYCPAPVVRVFNVLLLDLGVAI